VAARSHFSVHDAWCRRGPARLRGPAQHHSLVRDGLGQVDRSSSTTRPTPPIASRLRPFALTTTSASTSLLSESHERESGQSCSSHGNPALCCSPRLWSSAIAFAPKLVAAADVRRLLLSSRTSAWPEALGTPASVGAGAESREGIPCGTGMDGADGTAQVRNLIITRELFGSEARWPGGQDRERCQTPLGAPGERRRLGSEGCCGLEAVKQLGHRRPQRSATTRWPGHRRRPSARLRSGRRPAAVTPPGARCAARP
jgi:hypothetical protein